VILLLPRIIHVVFICLAAAYAHLVLYFAVKSASNVRFQFGPIIVTKRFPRASCAILRLLSCDKAGGVSDEV